jgi:hypothetical protein
VSAAHRVHGLAAGRYPHRRPPRPQPVTVTTVNPAAMAKALELAGGDARRLEIRNKRTVIVLNNPRGA